MKSRRIWIVTLIACAALGLATLIGTSPSFEKCEHERKNHQSYSALHEESPLLVKAIVRLKLHASCARQTASENDGAIAGLSGIAVAMFTLALWISTRALWVETKRLAEGAEAQSTDLKRSIEIAQAHANAASAALGLGRAWMCDSRFNIEIAGKGPGGVVPVKDRVVFSVLWKNEGRSPATNANVMAEIVAVPFNCANAPAFQANWDNEAGNRTIGPNGTAISRQMEITGNDFIDFTSQKISICLYSKIVYRDVFEPNLPRHTEICCLVSLSGIRFIPGRMSPEPEFNIMAVGSQNTIV